MSKTNDQPKNAGLRNRPFLIVERYIQPKKPVHGRGAPTSRKGWMNDPDTYDVEEFPEIVNAVKDRHLAAAVVIIDIMQGRVVKNRLNSSDAEVLSTYMEKYNNAIQRSRYAANAEATA